MKYVQINSHSGAWADSVIFKKHREMTAQGIDSYVFWGRGKPTVNDHEQRFMSPREAYLDSMLTRLDGKMGFHSKGPTRRLLRRLDKIRPDVVHLHSISGSVVDVAQLFDWLRTHDCQVIWTLHDCWAFTGGCIFFTMTGCDKWRTHCELPCPSTPDIRPPVWRYRSKVDWCYEEKKLLFASLPADRMTLYTPSQWLADLTRESFLAKYPVEVVHNTVDSTIFHPSESNFRERQGLQDKFLVLGVAGSWDSRKGYEDLIRLAQELDGRFAVVVVGLNDDQLAAAPHDTPATFIGIKRTESREELVGLYSTADVLFNPTKEDNYPTVNLEAEACGTPVVTYDVGGCRETLHREGSRPVSGFDEGFEAIRAMCDGRRETEGGVRR